MAEQVKSESETEAKPRPEGSGHATHICSSVEQTIKLKLTGLKWHELTKLETKTLLEDLTHWLDLVKDSEENALIPYERFVLEITYK
jgi:hypothetical protein